MLSIIALSYSALPSDYVYSVLFSRSGRVHLVMPTGYCSPGHITCLLGYAVCLPSPTELVMISAVSVFTLNMARLVGNAGTWATGLTESRSCIYRALAHVVFSLQLTFMEPIVTFKLYSESVLTR